MLAASVLDVVETQVSETNLEEDGYYVCVAEDDTCSEDQIIKISKKLHSLLLNLTTGEANAVGEAMPGDMDCSHGSGCAPRLTRGPWYQVLKPSATS